MSDTAQEPARLTLEALGQFRDIFRPIASGMNFLASLPCGEGRARREETSTQLFDLIDRGKETLTAILDKLKPLNPEGLPDTPGYKTALNYLPFLRATVSQWQELSKLHASPEHKKNIEDIEYAYGVETKRWIGLRERLSQLLQIDLTPQPNKAKGEGSAPTAEGKPADGGANKRPTKGKNIDARMFKFLAENSDHYGWSAKRMAERLECHPSTVKGGKAWEQVKRVRAAQEAELKEKTNGQEPPKRDRRRNKKRMT